MRDCTALCNKAGEHVATTGFNEAFGLWQIVVVNREGMEFFCPSKEIALAAWHDEFDPETGFPKSCRPLGLTLDSRISKPARNFTTKPESYLTRGEPDRVRTDQVTRC